MITKYEFIKYANAIRNYSNAVIEIGELLHIELLESKFADPLDIMQEMLFTMTNRNLSQDKYDALSEEFWYLVLYDDINDSNWEELYNKILNG